MSKKPTSFAISLRTDNVKALLLIKAISNESLESVTKIIKSVPTGNDKLALVESIIIQGHKTCETLSDREILLKLASQNVGDNTYKIMLLVRSFINQANCQYHFNDDLAREREKYEAIKNSSRLLDQEIESLFKGYEIVNLTGGSGGNCGGSENQESTGA